MVTKSPLIAAVAVASLFAVSAPAFAGTTDSLHRYAAKPVHRGEKLVYCVSQTVTGSNIPQRTCMTKTEWSQAGAVVLEKNAQDYALREQTVRQN